MRCGSRGGCRGEVEDGIKGVLMTEGGCRGAALGDHNEGEVKIYVSGE